MVGDLGFDRWFGIIMTINFEIDNILPPTGSTSWCSRRGAARSQSTTSSWAQRKFVLVLILGMAIIMIFRIALWLRGDEIDNRQRPNRKGTGSLA